MKRIMLIVFILLLLCPLSLLASSDEGLHYYSSVGIFSSGVGIGYRNGRFEIGGTVSSSALNAGLVMLCTNFRPISGFLIGAVAFGGADVYARYDLIPHPKYELSIGVGGCVTYCLVGALDYAATTFLSIRASISNKNGIVFFFETSAPLFSYEYSNSVAPSPDEDLPSSTETVIKGFVYPNPSFGAKAAMVMTTRVGAEVSL